MAHATPHVPFAFSSGPQDARIAIVGEAWGEQEALTGLPFVGSSGQELTRMLAQAGIARRDCFLTNAFNLRPQGNNMETLCVKKAELPADYTLPALSLGNYIAPQHLPHIDRLRAELLAVAPNIIIALGNTALWALARTSGINRVRGTISDNTLVPGIKMLPTYHPAYILRDWASRPIAIVDLMKAAREAEFPEIRRPQREVLINPTLDEVRAFCRAEHAIISSDIETVRGQIDCIGFAPSPRFCLVVPFILPGFASYWPDVATEVAVWREIKHLLERPMPKLFQNGLYDLQYIMQMGIRPRNVIDDTMLLHHALYPEMRKGLGFLGSLYTNEAAWKLLRENRETTKRDE